MEPVKKPTTKKSISSEKKQDKEIDTSVPNGEVGVDVGGEAKKKILLADPIYEVYINDLNETISAFFKENSLLPSKEELLKLKNVFEKNTDTFEVSKYMENFIKEYCDYLMLKAPKINETNFKFTDKLLDSVNHYLNEVKEKPFLNFDFFMNEYKQYYSSLLMEIWYYQKMNEDKYLQLKKNITEANHLNDEYMKLNNYLNLVKSREILPDTDINTIIDPKFIDNVENKIKGYEHNKVLKEKYDKKLECIKIDTELFIEKIIKENIKKPNAEIIKYTQKFDEEITSVKTHNLANCNMKNDENLEKKISENKANLKEKVKEFYKNKLNDAVNGENYLDLKITEIDKISNNYTKNLISSAILVDRIKKAIVEQYSPSRQIWLENILKFGDAKLSEKGTTGDTCTELTSENFKSTHSTLYRMNVPDKENVKEKSKNDIYDMVLGKKERMCFHVSTQSFFVTRKQYQESSQSYVDIEGEYAAHAYRRGKSCLHFHLIGEKFTPLTIEELNNQLTIIKNVEVDKKEKCILNAIDNHFHGYQNISKTFLVK